MEYKDLDLKQPIEDNDYEECSNFLVNSIDAIILNAIADGQNKIIINTNLKRGMPMENINKIAGPFVEAWAFQVFYELLEDTENKFQLINVEAGERLNMADVILQFKKTRKSSSSVTANIDVKATSMDIENSGKSPNISSFARIRTEYIRDPNFFFIILSIKHSVYSTRDPNTKMMLGVMEVVDFNSYDLKFISDKDISYNPSLGTGQLQLRDVHYVTKQVRTTWQFCQLLDKKCIASKRGFLQWYDYAVKYGWIK